MLRIHSPSFLLPNITSPISLIQPCSISATYPYRSVPTYMYSKHIGNDQTRVQRTILNSLWDSNRRSSAQHQENSLRCHRASQIQYLCFSLVQFTNYSISVTRIANNIPNIIYNRSSICSSIIYNYP